MTSPGKMVSEAIRARMEETGIIPSPEADVLISNEFRCEKLIQGVWIKMQLCGETDVDQATVAIVEYAEILAEPWPSMDVLADRIIGKYYRTHGIPELRTLHAERTSSLPSEEEGERYKVDETLGDAPDNVKKSESGEAQTVEAPEEEFDPLAGKPKKEPSGGEESPTDVPTSEEISVPEPARDSDGRILPKEFPLLLELIKRGKFVCLIGPTGTGKSEMAKNAARVLGKKLFVSTAPQMSYDITGFVDAHGRYVRKPFSEAFMEGGMCLMDEIDRAGPEALIVMDAPISNGIMYIEGVGQVERHPDFLFVATANTAGTGADQEYVTANQLDASTRDRLVYLRVDYDENIENECAKGDAELVEFAHAWRRACEESGTTNALFSYRGIEDLKELSEEPMFGMQRALEMSLVKCALSRDTLLVIRKRMKCENRYSAALDAYIAGMKETFRE